MQTEYRFLKVAELAGLAVAALDEYHAACAEARANRRDEKDVPFPSQFGDLIRSLIRHVDELIPRPEPLRPVLSAAAELAQRLHRGIDWAHQPSGVVEHSLRRLCDVIIAPRQSESSPLPAERPPLESARKLLADGCKPKQIAKILGLTQAELLRELAEPGSVTGCPDYVDPRDFAAVTTPEVPFPSLSAIAALAAEFRAADPPQPPAPHPRKAEVDRDWSRGVDPRFERMTAGVLAALAAEEAARLRELVPA